MVDDNFEEFVKYFDIRYNAMDMRTITRWNGRNLRSKENVSEHTHLVVACTLWLYDQLIYKQCISFENIVRLAMLHDACEALRGDILSVTKDAIPQIRDFIEKEEKTFLTTFVNNPTEQEYDLVHIADLLACYLFLKWESQYPSNEFAMNALSMTFERFRKAMSEFTNKYNAEWSKQND